MQFVQLNFQSFRPQQHQCNDAGYDDYRHRPTTARRTAIPTVTDLRALCNKRILLVVDADNMDYSLKPQGWRFRYRELLNRLTDGARMVFPAAVLTAAPGDRRRATSLENHGWRVLSIPWETVASHQGLRKLANADLDIAFECGSLASISGCEAVLIGTGDGDLAVSIARGLRRTHQRSRISVHTLSVAGASSSRLRQRTDLFDSSIIVGKDLLENTVNE